VATGGGVSAILRQLRDPEGEVPVAFKCEIRVRGRLSRALTAEFEQFDLTARTEPVETVLQGSMEEQAALHVLLRQIEAFGLELVEVRRAPGVPPAKRESGDGANHRSTGIV